MEQLLVITRHGQTEWSRNAQFTSRSDIPMTPQGEAQAALAGNALAAHPISQLLSSPKARAVHTAAIIRNAQLHAAPDLTVDERLLEVDAGPFEGQNPTQLKRGPLAESFLAWRREENPIFPEGAETYASAAARADSLFAHLRTLSGLTVVVTHGYFSRVLVAHCVLGVPISRIHRMRLDTAHFAVVSFGTGSPRLVAFNTESLPKLDAAV